MAKLVAVGRPAHDSERQALAFLVRGLPDTHTVYANSWIAQRDGTLFELDAVVVAPHAVFVVEIKSYRGAIRGTDHDWLVPEPRPSPLRVNRLTAQILNTEVRRISAAAGRPWVEGYVFLSHTNDVKLRGTASQHRVHTRNTILPALVDVEYFRKNLSRGRYLDLVDEHARSVYHQLLTGVDKRRPPPRQIREWELLSVLDRTDDHVDYLVRHRLYPEEQVLRVYKIPWAATEELRQRIEDRCKWEAQVMVSVGRHPDIVTAQPPFVDEIGVCLPLERFNGISLTSWCERFLAAGEEWPALDARLRIWHRTAAALHFAHQQGVVHRFLRPEVILVADAAAAPEVRLTGFELAKQPQRGATVSASVLDASRMVWAAPEIVRDFHEAEARSDQFSLGALLGLLCTGRPLFESTVALLGQGGPTPRLQDFDPRIPRALDEVAQRMLAPRAVDRFDTVADAMRAVEAALRRDVGSGPASVATALDPDNLLPGQRLGTDYEIRDRLGSGGLATVYQALHLMSGQVRALKVARPTEAAEQALRDEYEVVRHLDHPAIVRVVDLSGLVPARLTLVMERVDGRTLSQWLTENPDPDASMLRRYAEDLLDALAYLESRQLVHKDIKPDNLLLGPQGLTLIDFSLADVAPQEITVGTSLYRDPTLTTWDAAADRYAAALCLFELFVGAHAFDGRVPPPDEPVRLDEDEVDPPGLAAFLGTALAPDRADRYPTLDAMRQALRRAMGAAKRGEDSERDLSALQPEPAAPLVAAALSRGSYNALTRAGIRTQGQLVAAGPEALLRVRGIGRLRLREVTAYRGALIELGVPETAEPPPPPAPKLALALADDPRSIEDLDISKPLAETLAERGYVTIGQVAAATEPELRAIPWFGPVKVTRVRLALEQLATFGAAPVQTLDRTWQQACRDLSDRQREVLERMLAYQGPPPTQSEVAEALGVTRQAVHMQYHAALDRLDGQALEPAFVLVAEAVAEAGGILPVPAAVTALVEDLPTEDEGLAVQVVRLVGHEGPDGLKLVAGLAALRAEVLVRPEVGAAGLARFLEEVYEQAQWPPQPAEASRRSLAAVIPHYTGDPLKLATTLAVDVRQTPAGELFLAPVEPAAAIPFVLQTERLPVALTTLEDRARAVFGDALRWPEGVAIDELLAALDLGDLRVEGDQVVAAPRAGVQAVKAQEDQLPDFLLVAERSPEQVAGEVLRAAAQRSSGQLVVTPPERHRAIGRNVAAAIGPEARFVSFEDLFLARIEDRFDAFENAELFSALRPQLTREAKALLDELMAQYGRQGEVVVLGDTAILGLCQAVHLVTQLFETVAAGGRGFWAVVVPGVVYEHTPLFNESDRMPARPGSVIPLRGLIPVAA